MPVSARLLVLVTLLIAVGLLTVTGAYAPSDAPDIQLQLGQLLYADGRYSEAQAAFRRAVRSEAARVRVPARMGLVLSSLRIAEFGVARSEAGLLKAERPDDAPALAIYGDAMWASGLFDEAAGAYRDALGLQPGEARAHAGLARVLAARTRYAEALDHALTAVRLAPNESDYYHVVGNAYERLGRFADAAVALDRFISLLPKGYTDSRARWARSELRFLRSFGRKVPYETAGAPGHVYVLPFRLANEKIVISGRINGGTRADFIVDTGAELTTMSRRAAEREGVSAITYTVSAGVGEVGLRGLQLGRIDTLEFGALKVKNVPCIIKTPALVDLPTAEGESLSPLALGMSMSIDYAKRVITLAQHLPPEDGPADETMGLWMHRLATVRGTVGADHARSFVVDTGGQVISISTATADSLARPASVRRIPLKVYGVSGWDRDAYLLPGVDLAFNDIRFNKLSVVVLNLRAPSVLLGYELGGIVGHQFLSRYRVSFDLDRAELRLKKL